MTIFASPLMYTAPLEKERNTLKVKTKKDNFSQNDKNLVQMLKAYISYAEIQHMPRSSDHTCDRPKLCFRYFFAAYNVVSQQIWAAVFTLP